MTDPNDQTGPAVGIVAAPRDEPAHRDPSDASTWHLPDRPVTHDEAREAMRRGAPYDAVIYRYIAEQEERDGAKPAERKAGTNPDFADEEARFKAECTIERFRSGGEFASEEGSAVRVTHCPTGYVAVEASYAGGFTAYRKNLQRAYRRLWLMVHPPIPTVFADPKEPHHD